MKLKNSLELNFPNINGNISVFALSSISFPFVPTSRLLPESLAINLVGLMFMLIVDG